MRITKEFVRACHDRAQSQAQKASQASTRMLQEYLVKPEQMDVLLEHLFPPEMFTLMHKKKEHDKELLCLLISSEPHINPAIYERLKKSLDDTAATAHPFLQARGSEETLALRLKLRIRNEDEIMSVVEVDTTSLFEDESIKQKYSKNIAKMQHFTCANRWASSTETPIDVESVFGKATSERFTNLLSTTQKLQDLKTRISKQSGTLETYTTLAQLESNELVWPLIKNDDYVTKWIHNKQQQELAVKEEKEEMLRMAREKAADDRARKLAYIKEMTEAGLPIEIPKVKKNDNDVSLITALNRMNEAQKGN